MIKKLLIFSLCFALIIGTLPTVFATEPDITAKYSTKNVTVGETFTVTFSVEETVTELYAAISTNGMVNIVSGAEYDDEKRTYCIAFNSSQKAVTVEFSADNKGDGYIYLSADTMATIAFGVRVHPEYTPIYTKEDLSNIRNDLSGNYMLMNDIVFEESDFSEGGVFYNGGNGWIPIGAMPSCAFEGKLYGNGHTIEGLRINRAYYFYNGLFGVMSGEIEALRLKDTVIDITEGINTTVLVNPPEEQTAESETRAGIDYGDKDVWTDPNASSDEATLNKYDRSGESNALSGLFCGVNYGTIRESYAKGTSLGNRYIGGFAAINSGTIKNSAVNVNIQGASLAGGFAASATVYSKIYDSVAQGSFTATTKGALFGEANGLISRAYTLCDVQTAFASGQIQATEAYLADADTVNEVIFTKGEWDYTRVIPYPTAIADLVEKKAVFGDVDSSGATDTTDLALLKLFLVGAIDDTNIYPDIDDSGIADTTDLAILKLFLVGAG